MHFQTPVLAQLLKAKVSDDEMVATCKYLLILQNCRRDKGWLKLIPKVAMLTFKCTLMNL